MDKYLAKVHIKDDRKFIGYGDKVINILIFGDRPKEKIKWTGKVIDLAVLIIYLSNNRPEWLVVENVFGVKSTSLKSSLSNLRKRNGFNKKYHEIATEYEDVK